MTPVLEIGEDSYYFIGNVSINSATGCIYLPRMSYAIYLNMLIERLNLVVNVRTDDYGMVSDRGADIEPGGVSFVMRDIQTHNLLLKHENI